MPTQRRTHTYASVAEKGSYDWGLVTVVVSLLALGLVMVFSASYAQGVVGFENPYYFIMRQVIWATIGVVTLLVAARVPYWWWERFSIPLMGLVLLALLAVLAFGSDRFGATRTFFSGSVQPSEPAKIIIIVYVATWLASKGQRIRDVQVGLLPFSMLMGTIAVLIVTQPDIDTAILIVATASIMFFIAGAQLKQLLVVFVVTALTFALVINYSSYARGRVERYVASIENPLQSEEWQSVQSVRAFMNGGVTGVGVGDGTAKMPGYLPVSWSDNIFAVVGEEMGLIGALLIILLFGLLAYRGLRIALNARDNFGMLLATGITAQLILQAILNTAVVVAVAPPTGVTLPFVSYGGSSLVTALAAVGILLNISKDSAARSVGRTGSPAYARLDFGWWHGRPRVPSTGSSRSSAAPVRRYAGSAPRPSRYPSRGQSAGGRQAGHQPGGRPARGRQPHAAGRR